MKHRLIFVAALTAAGATWAQSTVTLSGGLAVAFKHQSGLSDGSKASTNSIANNDAAASNITFRATEDLGGGLKASALINVRFDATTGASTATGSTSAQFAQNVKLSLAGGFGEVSMGRFNGPVDTLRGALDMYMPLGLGTTVYGAPLDASTRYNGMLQYMTPTFGGFSAGIMVVPKANLSSTENTSEVALKYAAGPMVLGLGFTKNSGTGVTNVVGKDATTLGAAYDFGILKAGVTHTRVDAYGTTAESNRTSFGLRAPVANATAVKFGYERQKSKGANAVNAYAVGLEYSLSKRTMLSADLGKVSSDTLSKDHKGISYALGIKHSF